MEVIHSPDDARRYVWSLRSQGRTVGLVPTMGALHEGHLSLVKAAGTCDSTVATIFVNPTQFRPDEDLDKYPRSLDEDLEQLKNAGVKAVFVPDQERMYPEGFSSYVEPPEVAKPLEGICRPGHFRGVTTVVLKLLQAIPASHAYFGKKDYQQWRVIEAMVRDLNVGTKIIGCPTLRESDGLALSSRNRYLDPEQRRRALLLSKALSKTEAEFRAGETQIEELQQCMRRTLLGLDNAAAATVGSEHGSTPIQGMDKIDYAAIVAADTLTTLSSLDRPAVAVIAGYIGKTRLIDNRELNIS
ncbi:MAG: pantoate--beta-alanine ligase [Rubripirellula sp.]|nr:pantoate--beta-alanine ligase [Rubripirellula sp.]